MAMDSRIIGSIEEAAFKIGKKSGLAVDWFKDKLDVLRGVGNHPGVEPPGPSGRFPKNTDRNFLSTKMNVRSVGRMIMFAYDPKTKNKLPYYDVLPLVLVIDADARGFTGLNLHYVPPLLRKVILEALKKNINLGPIPPGRVSRSELGKIKLNYGILKKSSQFPIMRPCFKRYLFSHVRSSFLYVAPTEWEKSIMLPTEKFVKATKTKVFRDSVAMADQASKGLVKSLKPNKPIDVRTTDFFRGKREE